MPTKYTEAEVRSYATFWGIVVMVCAAIFLCGGGWVLTPPGFGYALMVIGASLFVSFILYVIVFALFLHGFEKQGVVRE